MIRPPGKRSARKPHSRAATQPLSAQPLSAQPRNRPAILRVFLLVLINVMVLVALVTVLEVAARLWFPREMRAVFDNPDAFRQGRPYIQGDAERGFALRAGYSTPRMTVNRSGFRALAPQQQEQVLRPERILCVGGSTTFGWGLADDESYPAQLQRCLDGAWPDRWSVINAGVPSYTSEQVCLYLPELLALEPSIIVVQTLWNDLLFSFVNDWYPELLVHQRPDPWRRFLLQHSAVYRALSLKEFDEKRVVVSSPQALRHYQKNLENIVQSCRARGVEVVLSMPPMQELLVPEDGMKIGSQNVPRPLFLETAAIFAGVMQSVARQEGVPLVQHRVALDAHPAETLFLDAAHPRAEGYRLLAEDVSHVIAEMQRAAAK